MADILIVEDDTNIAKTIEAVLQIAGYRSSVCSDGASDPRHFPHCAPKYDG